jgi:glutamate dehydrogenase
LDSITSHIHSLYAAKIAAFSRDDKTVMIRLDKEASDHAVYIDTSKPGISVVDGPRYEQRIDEKYLNPSTKKQAFRVETFRSNSLLPGSDDNMLRCYFVYQCFYNEGEVSDTETNIEKVGDKRFLMKATKNTKEIYQQILESAVGRTGPVIEFFDIEGVNEKRLVIAYKQGSALGLFSALSDLYHYYGLTSSRKYVEQFANGYTIMSVYLKPAPGNTYISKHVPIESSIHQIVKELSLLYCLPQNKFQSHFATGRLSLQETIYAHCVWVFTGHFINRLGSEYQTLASLLDVNNSVHAELLTKLKRRLRSETFTSDYIMEIINRYPDLIHTLYVSFANSHYVQMRGPSDDFIPTLSFQRIKIDEIPTPEKISKMIESETINEHHLLVMSSFNIFNQHVL